MEGRRDFVHPEGDLGRTWLAVGRLGAGGLLALLALTANGDARSPGLMLLAAGVAVAVAAVTPFSRGRRALGAGLFVADLAWITLAVAGAGNPEMGLTVLYPLVAFGAGLTLGGRTALGLSLAAGLALVAGVSGGPALRVDSGWIVFQGLLVLVLGAVSDRMRALLMSRERALAFASRALERMRLDTDTIVQNLGSGVLSVDRSGNVVHVNRTAEETLGIEAAEVRGRKAVEALPEAVAPLVEVLAAGLSDGRPVSRGEVEIALGGTTLPLGVGTTILRDAGGEITGVVALFQDLTEVRHRERLARRRDRLAAVGELAAGIAHEIRNSVLPISGSVEILNQELALDAEQKKLFEVISRETENVERFVSALLSYTRSQARHPAAVDLDRLAAETADDFRLARKDGPEVTVAGDGASVWAWADPDQIRQAVRNLVLNAGDASGPEGTVVIRAGRTAGGEAWLEVEDDGPGIPAEERERICQPFYTSKPGGTGLGLAIVSRIVEEHDGRLELLDSELGGARLRIVLQQPAETPATLAAA